MKISLPSLRRGKSSARGVRRAGAFSLVEVLLALGALVIVGAIGVAAMHRVSDRTRDAKINADVASLNAAVKIYLASGGDLSGATGVNDVLTRMKTVQTAAQSRTSINPLTGSMIDRRLAAEMQTAAEAATGAPRAFWNATDAAFEVRTGGGVGVKRFILDQSLASVANQTETRNGGVMEFSSNSGWVWDYKNDWVSDARYTPTGVNTTPFPSPPTPLPSTAGTATAGSATAGTATAGTATAGTATAGTATAGDDDGGDDGTPPPLPRLPTPMVNIGGGTYPPEDFPMMVTATNAGVYGTNGVLKYRINYGSWIPYSGPVAVPENARLRLLAYTNDPAVYQNSYQWSGYYYKVQPPRLPTPVLNKPGGAYLTEEFPLVVLVANAATYGSNGTLKYSLNGGAWQTYGSGMSVPADKTLRVQAFTTDPAAYRDSYQESEYYFAIAGSFSGDVTGKFQQIAGGQNLFFELSENDTHLSHGRSTIEIDGEIIDAGESNTMKYLNSNFSGVLPGEEFLLGEILYHNGTTFDNSHATRAIVKTTVTFTSPAATHDVNIQLELINTENSSDPEASADYVKFKNVNKTYNLDIDGSNYEMAVQFGTTDVNGFATGTEFHVYEGATARGELRATMRLKGGPGGAGPNGNSGPGNNNGIGPGTNQGIGWGSGLYDD